MADVQELANSVIEAGLVPETLAAVDWLNSLTDTQRAEVAETAGRIARAIDATTGEITELAATRVASAPDPANKPRRGELPPDMLDEFRQYRGGADKHQWDIGRVVDNKIIDFAGKFTAERIIKAAVKEMEISRGQVRKCRETWAATDASLRDEFDVLTFEHFAVLRFIGDRAKMQAYLKLCVESADMFNGKPMPAVILDKRVKKDLGLEPPPPTFGELHERAISAVENLRDAADTDRRHNAVVAVLALLIKIN